MNKLPSLFYSHYMLAAWVRFLSECVLLSNVESSSGYGGRSLRFIHFLFVVTEFTFITGIFACGVQLTALGVGGIITRNFV